jgi:hypothetical protein
MLHTNPKTLEAQYVASTVGKSKKWNDDSTKLNLK